jgi:uncharacterized sulfatase
MRTSISRRGFLSTASGTALGLAGLSLAGSRAHAQGARPPNILFAIADDWSWPYASVAGAKAVHTPNFDRVAREGCLFNNAFVAAPQCSPNRAAILTGRHIWQLEEAGTHGSLFPNKFKVFPDLLESAGYHVGFTGKGWGPGDWKRGGWSRNPAGPDYSQRKLDSAPYKGINKVDYAGNFEEFIEKRPDGSPFCFWYGCHEPHRSYQQSSGIEAGKKAEDASVPEFLPDAPEVRSDLLDYFLEIEWFDEQLGKMLAKLEACGELDNTIVVVTSDNGMPFPRAKANLYEYGVHMPLAIRWGAQVKAGRTSRDLISFVDFAPTFLDAAGVVPPADMTGKSFLGLLTSETAGPNEYVLFGRERHTHARYDNLGYPARALRTQDYLYIHNFKPDRWPAGDPDGFEDIDGGPSKTFLLEHRDQFPRLFDLAVGKRPAEELYDVRGSQDCMINLAESPEHKGTLDDLGAKLTAVLTAQKDPRALGTGDVFESYPRFSPMRPQLGGFAERDAYNPRYQPK